MKKDSKVFYPARGTTKSEGQPEGARTQYGWTSTFCGLQLHIGDHMYRKRGGLYRAFLFDVIDYRYEGLLRSLGIDDVPALGVLIGTLCEKQEGDGDLIRFRVTDDRPTDIVVCYDYNEVKLEDVVALQPTAVSVSAKIPHMDSNSTIYDDRWIQAVFPLDRINDTEDVYEDYFDGLYDEDPDVADLTHCHAGGGVDSDTVIETRLRAFGF